MIDQNLQAAIPSLRDATRSLLPCKGTVSFSTRRFSLQRGLSATRSANANANANAELQEFIDNRPDAREVRKALAVKLVYQDYKYEEIQTILDVFVGLITSWKNAYMENSLCPFCF
ncbi:hypothetical protein [Nostoc sp. LPT]|uniref:hypothetical protein n=1 Tax=Nostoc sp. LPT TaxID=2815387 RepID=UPI001D3E8B7E|nr:hypothetical protein [Nostoc sp. LPT]MBN4001103.1 hypothetical protein [Nostoc sp. LPT]